MKKTEQVTKRKVRWSTLPCPECGEKGPLLEIQYGYLASEPDSNRFIAGGCCVDFNQPELSRRNCDWSGTKEDLRALSAPTVILTSRFLDAMNYANKHHASQTRKAGNIAYISHRIGVAGLIIEARGDEDQAIGDYSMMWLKTAVASHDSKKSRSNSVPESKLLSEACSPKVLQTLTFLTSYL